MRAVQLEKLVAMLSEIEILIRFRALRTGELISELTEQESFKNFLFLNILSLYIADGETDINRSWLAAAGKTAFLNESDKRILVSVGEQLGSTDIDGQLSMLALNKTLAQRNLCEAENDCRIKGKMFKNVWGLCGLAAGIMLF